MHLSMAVFFNPLRKVLQLAKLLDRSDTREVKAKSSSGMLDGVRDGSY